MSGRQRIALLAALGALALLPLLAGGARGAGLAPGGVALPLIAAGPSRTPRPPLPTATRAPSATPAASATPSRTPAAQPANYTIPVGPGYTDVSPKALVRTSANRLYIVVSTCEAYPCTAAGQRLRVYRANSTGVPSGFTLVGDAGSPAGVSQWAIAIDGADTIHVLWNERAADDAPVTALRYGSFATASDRWGAGVETIDGALGLDATGQGVQSLALALDAGGAPHVVYLKGGGAARRAFHRARGAQGWSAPTQLDDGVSYAGNQKAWHPNLAFDPAGRLLVAWQRGSFNTDNDGTIFTRVRAANGSWGAPVNASGSDAARVTIDQSTSLLVTPDGRYHLTWISAVNDYIRYQYSDNAGQSWSANHPGSGVQATHNPSLGYAAGRLRIYGHGTPVPAPDGRGEDLYFFEGAGGAAGWGAWTKFVSGTNYDSSVNVRWSQFFCSFPNTIDLAYWNDNYPNILYAGSEIKAP
jgi:hypothetical protein